MTIPRPHHMFPFNNLNVTPAALALALLLLALVAPARADPGHDDQAPDLGDCQKLQVRPGNKVFFHAFGVGVQIYRWNGESWDFVAPAAVLFANSSEDSAVGMHFAGPTWQSVGGSKVVGTVIEHCTPDPDAIPWLLLGAASTEGPGLFRRVTYIQRLNTVGGKAPNHPGAFPGDVARVPYTADYFFYHRAHH
ncbi:DUF3455 domain-containing protein [Singulisphaera sp. Ch08]|uniref:DUF3455 domain-containing protein n=1 Tax=Singulisphaera sp. Ch08 TaxID=3120278 RepID=A0AAU7CB96_9BACT